MGNVVPIRKIERKIGIRGGARMCLTGAMKEVGKPVGVVVVALGVDGSFALRSTAFESLHLFDLLARAGAVVDREKMQSLE